jgi:hypothetical protein
MCFPLRRLLSFLFVPFILISPLAAQEAGDEGAEEKDWLEFYYETPTPDRFIPQMKDWAGDGTLDNDHAKPALIAFISQLIRQNREKLAEWYDGLAGLDPKQKQVMHTAMLFSRTEEADAILKAQFGQAYEDQKAETKKILEMPLDQRDTVDMLWGFFYATGSPEPIRRLIFCFRFKDAPDKPDGVEVPEGFVPLYKELPDFARNSLLANGERHALIVKILQVLLEKDESLMDVEKAGVRAVLEELGQLPSGKEA